MNSKLKLINDNFINYNINQSGQFELNYNVS